MREFTPTGLCNTCAHQRVVVSGRGSSFSLCGLARDDERFAKYPRLPVLACPGYLVRKESVESNGATTQLD